MTCMSCMYLAAVGYEKTIRSCAGEGEVGGLVVLCVGQSQTENKSFKS